MSDMWRLLRDLSGVLLPRRGGESAGGAHRAARWCRVTTSASGRVRGMACRRCPASHSN